LAVFSAAPEQRYLIGVDREACSGDGQVVGDDEV
jgi:hypothetical protein